MGSGFFGTSVEHRRSGREQTHSVWTTLARLHQHNTNEGGRAGSVPVEVLQSILGSRVSNVF